MEPEYQVQNQSQKFMLVNVLIGFDQKQFMVEDD